MDGRHEGEAPTKSISPGEVLRLRRKHIGYNISLSYNEPLNVVRGSGTYLYTCNGTEYLDCINNVCHVGHCNPKVTKAVCQQICMLNTNSRYLHPTLSKYSKMLTDTMPDSLEVLFMVCSGSEANDLALRITQAARPGQHHIVVVGGAYHGHTSALVNISPYKFWGPGGSGLEPHVHVIPCPDPYRNTDLDGASAARAAVRKAHASGGKIGAFFCESVLSCGGQVVLPDGYLKGIYEVMREEGALCVADEVQVGFGRVGSAFWGFETQGVVPDIVTLGKPIANGYPVGAVVTSAELAYAFNNGMEYFNTYGGSTAAAAAALATLEVALDDRLQGHARDVGNYLSERLRGLSPVAMGHIGDVRGLGLFVGVEIVVDRDSKRHAPVLAKWLCERAKAAGVLLSCDGPFSSVLKIKPPMVFSYPEADRLVSSLENILTKELPPVRNALLEQERNRRPSVDNLIRRFEDYKMQLLTSKL